MFLSAKGHHQRNTHKNLSINKIKIDTRECTEMYQRHYKKIAKSDYQLRLDFHKSVLRDMIVKVTNHMQLYRLIYYS